jgi:hypothetical protein
MTCRCLLPLSWRAADAWRLLVCSTTRHCLRDRDCLPNVLCPNPSMTQANLLTMALAICTSLVLWHYVLEGLYLKPVSVTHQNSKFVVLRIDLPM